MLCEKIEDDLTVERMRTRGPQLTIWRWFNRHRIHEVVDEYTQSGKRLQREDSINVLFQQAQLLNSLFHAEIQALLQSFGDVCHFEPGPIKTPARAIEKVVRRYYRRPSHLTDIVRCRVFFKDFQSVSHFVEDIRSKALLPDNSFENELSHDSSTCIFKICGVKNRFSSEYRAIDSFGFRDLQLNLEVGFRDGKIVPCQEWSSSGVKRHICEVQVLITSAGQLDAAQQHHTYGLLRDMAGK